MLAGLDEAVTDNAMFQRHQDDLGQEFIPIRPAPGHAMSVAWPPAILLLMGTLGTGRKLNDLLTTMKSERNMEAAEALRALEIAIAGGLMKRR
jgi:hypothetical protein